MMSCGAPLDMLGPEWRSSSARACAREVGWSRKREGRRAGAEAKRTRYTYMVIWIYRQTYM